MSKQEILAAAKRTWQAIGGDSLRSLEEETGETTMPREEVVEAVIDYIGEYGFSEPNSDFQNMTYEEKKALLLEAFPHKSYSM